jgi:hypothetical protein
MRGRDDRALLAVAERLPGLLADTVPNPTDPDESLCKALGRDDRQRAIACAETLAGHLAASLAASEPRAAIASLQRVLGPRIPDRPDLVGVEAPAVLAVRSVAPKIVPAPVVGRSISG